MLHEEDLLGLPLEHAEPLLQGYAVSLVESDANHALNKKLGAEFCCPRIVRVRIADGRVELVYSRFKELSL